MDVDWGRFVKDWQIEFSGCVVIVEVQARTEAAAIRKAHEAIESGEGQVVQYALDPTDVF